MTINSSQAIPPSLLLTQRRAGVILHPTSLPSLSGLGDLGPDAYRFIDFMVESGLSIWQILPIGPVHSDLSPYMGLSVYAGNPELISLELLVEWDLLFAADVNNEKLSGGKKDLFIKAQNKFSSNNSSALNEEYQQFIHQNGSWVHDFAMFDSLRNYFVDKVWSEWPDQFRHRDERALSEFKRENIKEVEQIIFEQFLFYKQWYQLKKYANDRNIVILGDMPIFVAHDSADVWQNQQYFDLNSDGSARVIAGVPPDYFSETGQRWGNPLYRWDKLAEDNYQWWVDRFQAAFTQYDCVRVDHFRGFEAYWEIDASEETAINGRWVKAPGEAMFKVLMKNFDSLPIVVEDLGIITREVDELREQFGWPGMKILQFAFDGNRENPYLPHKHVQNCVVYSGTHDNDTTLSWYEDLPDNIKEEIKSYLGMTAEPMPWSIIECAFRSVANWAIVPMQDILSLGKGNRMNVPGVSRGNWSWQFRWDQVNENLSSKIKTMIVQFERDV